MEGNTMFSSTEIDPTNPLTPSELVYLNGEHFAKKVLVGNIELLHTDEKVSMAQLGEAMLAAAFLANEAIGAVRLDIREKKALLGLRKVDSLFVDPLNPEGIWPSPSLERDLAARSSETQAERGGKEVRQLLYDWIERDATVPWKTVFERANHALTQRGILQATEETRLKVFRTTHYSVPSSTKALLASQSVEQVRAMIDSCQRDRPTLWKQLTHHIQRAIRDRKESDDDFD